VIAAGPAARPVAPAGRRRALLIANPRSRLGGTPLDGVREVLEAAGIALVPESPASADAVAAAIRARAGEIDAVVVAGGDGTMNAAAPALIETGLPLGILPAGTANDLARTLGLPLDLAAAARIIAAGSLRRIDVGRVNGHCFFNVASLGLSAELAMSLTREAKRRWGRLSYALAALRALGRARPFGATIVSDTGTVHVTTLQIAVGNGLYYGGGMAVEASAAIDDHHLDLYSLELARAWKLPFMLPSFRAGRHGAWREVRTDRCTSFEIRTRRPRPINTDGEIVTTTPARFEVLPRAISVFAEAREAEAIGGRAE
jgi:YegS/Rv2252/BmrU family lipid kinase